MPLFDDRVPRQLLEVQKWFGGVIAQPLEDLDLITKIAPSGESIEKEAPSYILPGPTLKSHERIQIYNQQYWWRLLNVLQENFPYTLRLFGYMDFNNSLAIPYLQAHRPNDWTLNSLGADLPGWIDRCYEGEDKQLVYDAALIDWTDQWLFFQIQHPSIESDEDLVVKRLYLQPSSALLKFSYDIKPFRGQLLKEGPDYWLDHPFPSIDKNPSFLILYRNAKGKIVSKSLNEVEWLILKEFEGGRTIDEICEWIEKQSDVFRSEAETHLQRWFGEWTVMGIFAIQN